MRHTLESDTSSFVELFLVCQMALPQDNEGFRLGEARRGEARRGEVRRGEVRLGKVKLGEARLRLD